MKKILIIINIFFCVIAGLAQTPIDTTVLVCEYKYTYVLDPATNKGGMETMRLEIGKMQNMFYNPNNESFNARLENFNNVDINNQADVATALQMIRSGGKRFNYDAAFKIYSDYAKSKIVVTDQIRSVKYQYTEDIEKIDWNLYDETIEILGYTCKKATCKFRGRDYEAWYAVDIPINKGPWKFNGLPGLILKITDSKPNFQFMCLSVEKKEIPIYYNEAMDIIKTTRKEFMAQQKKYSENTLSAHNIKIRDADGNLDLPVIKIPYNPIELE